MCDDLSNSLLNNDMYTPDPSIVDIWNKKFQISAIHTKKKSQICGRTNRCDYVWGCDWAVSHHPPPYTHIKFHTYYTHFLHTHSRYRTEWRRVTTLLEFTKRSGAKNDSLFQFQKQGNNRQQRLDRDIRHFSRHIDTPAHCQPEQAFHFPRHTSTLMTRNGDEMVRWSKTRREEDKESKRRDEKAKRKEDRERRE